MISCAKRDCNTVEKVVSIHFLIEGIKIGRK